MVKGFISKIGNVMEFQELLSLFEQNGVDADNIIINQPLIELTSNLSSGDKLVLISYCDVFLGLSDMFDRCIALADSGMEVRSIKEPEIVFNGEQLSMMRKLHTLGREMRSRRTLNGVNKAKAQGKRLGPNSTPRPLRWISYAESQVSRWWRLVKSLDATLRLIIDFSEPLSNQ